MALLLHVHRVEFVAHEIVVFEGHRPPLLAARSTTLFRWPKNIESVSIKIAAARPFGIAPKALARCSGLDASST